MFIQKKWRAHLTEDGREQTILEHLYGTAELASGFANSFGYSEQGELVGMAHDIGKYAQAFQDRLDGSPLKVDHATAGAFECLKLKNTPAMFCVSGHHGGLPDGGGKGDIGTATMFSRLKKAKSGQIEDYSAWKNEVTLPKISQPAWYGKDKLRDAFYVRMLYSCLVDADFLDTEQFVEGKRYQPDFSDVEELNHKLDDYIHGWFPPQGELNQKRCEILTRCMEQGSTLPQGLFTLTVPTGGGKTVSSLAFALRHAQKHQLKRIIYVIPYTSIIEQTADIFRNILGKENVLEHHSGVHASESSGLRDTEDTIRIAKAVENWDIPVVVTTAVQFFESLYANRSSKCRKLHNIAQSVVIFDEAQMIPLSCLRPCVSAISELTAHYNVSAVLCTATQPALNDLFQEFIPDHSIRELCAPELYEDRIFERVQFEQRGLLAWDELCEEMNQQNQVLCIVNSRKNACTVYQSLKGEGIFHLSTLMCPAHRRAVLKTIRQRLTSGETCKVVSTSLIEAGVDVDFPSVYRESAGLDSILQAAGRCNREGKRRLEESVVHIFKAEAPVPPLFSTAVASGEIVMEEQEEISSQEAIAQYFCEYRDLKGVQAQDKEDILKLLKTENFPFKTVSERFRLIENNTKTIYILYGEGMRLLERYRSGERSKGLFRELNQYSVSVYEQHWKSLLEAGDIEPLEGTEDWVLINPNLYSEKTGLSLNADYGKALFI